jgi:hypothetical protein
MAMTWTTFHRRGEVLRTLTSTADARRDGLLPMDVAGVRETFGDEVSVIAALQLRWHTRLSGHLEHALMHQPTDLDDAVVVAWHATADELPGTRMVLDHYRAEPVEDAMARVLRTSVAKEHLLLAAMTGRTGADRDATISVGRALEERARATYQPPPDAADLEARHRRRGLLDRVRGRLVA